jgi:hypothetical protein
LLPTEQHRVQGLGIAGQPRRSAGHVRHSSSTHDSERKHLYCN